MKISNFSQLVQIEQTLFGLPWVFCGAVFAYLASPEIVIGWDRMGWIISAFLSARFAGMAFNQWIDRKIDGENPRTQNRLIPRGVVSTLQAQALSCFFCLVLGVSCFMLGPVCFAAFPFIVFLLWLYSFTKRFTWGCHLVLGLICSLGPFFSFVTLHPQFSAAPFLLALALLCSIASNDAIYALQDLQFDRKRGLKSIPVRIGVDKTYLFSKILHCCTLTSLLALGLLLQLSFFYYIGLTLIGGMYAFFYRELQNSEGIYPVFFKSNALSGIILFIFSLIEVAWKGLLLG